MSSGIFDWDDEEEKREEPKRADFQQPANFQQPVEAVDYWSEIETQNTAWNDPWIEPAVEKEWDEEPVEYIPYGHESADETARRGGLAWSAGIVFFSSIVFMLFIGWGADLIFQSKPWGIVAGIVLGSILGFIQFFRISSQIINPKNKQTIQPLMSRDDDEV